MSSFMNVIEKRTNVDADGNENTTLYERTSVIKRNTEPDYIKVYTNMWAEFNGVPVAYRELFLQLAIRMTYCNSDDLNNAQLVNTGKPYSDSIMSALGWKIDMFKRGLRELSNTGVIKRVAKGVYQINPNYAGRGEWKYNPRLKRGGIEDLKAIFSFKEKMVSTEIIWSDDSNDSEINDIYHVGLNVSSDANSILKRQLVHDME